MAICALGSVLVRARPVRRRRVGGTLPRSATRLLLLASLELWGCLPSRTDAATSGGVAAGPDMDSWPQWRGPLRSGIVQSLPDRLSRLRLAWTLPTSSPGLGGLAATSDMAIVVDHAGSDDVYRAVNLPSGENRWECRRRNDTDVDFGPCPRATPLLADGRVFVLGAGGDLACLDADTGTVRWSRDFRRDFGTAELPTWGFCGSPLLVGGRLIVNPGASAGAVVALDPATGGTLWASPGRAANYSCFVAAVLGGVEQAVGYDKEGVGGWDIATGCPLWYLPVSSHKGYLVPTPQVANGQLLLAMPRGIELYAFEPGGSIVPEPVARNRRVRAELSTPLVLGDRVVAASGRLACLPLTQRLSPLWEGGADPRFRESGVTHFVATADGTRVIAFCYDGTAILYAASGPELRSAEERKLHEGGWSHPAVLPHLLLCRDSIRVYGYAIEASAQGTPATAIESARIRTSRGVALSATE